MTGARRAVATAIVTGHELYPFSPYAMFAARGSDEWGRFALFIVPRGGGPQAETRVDVSRMMAPFDTSRAQRGLRHLLQRPEDIAEARRALLGLATIYERRRAQGLHDGPPCAALRLYRMQRPSTTGRALPGEPLERRLVVEAAFPTTEDSAAPPAGGRP